MQSDQTSLLRWRFVTGCIVWFSQCLQVKWTFSTGSNGLGFMAFSPDWATMSAILGSPLSTPWPTLLNVFIGFVFAAYVVVPALYWGDWYHTKRYPIVSNKLFLANGHRYNVSAVSHLQLEEVFTHANKILLFLASLLSSLLYDSMFAFISILFVSGICRECTLHTYQKHNFSVLKLNNLFSDLKASMTHMTLTTCRWVRLWWRVSRSLSVLTHLQKDLILWYAGGWSWRLNTWYTEVWAIWTPSYVSILCSASYRAHVRVHWSHGHPCHPLAWQGYISPIYDTWFEHNLRKMPIFCTHISGHVVNKC